MLSQVQQQVVMELALSATRGSWGCVTKFDEEFVSFRRIDAVINLYKNYPANDALAKYYGGIIKAAKAVLEALGYTVTVD